MVYEITGSRILSPYVGTSTYTWTSLIGVILAALGIGYWIAGSMADRRPSASVLAGALLLASGLVAATILAKEVILSAVSQNSLPLELKAVLASLLLFAPAACLMGFIVPYAVKLKTHSLDETGITVGRLYALSTAGSILGTFLAGFVLIPYVGSSRTLYAVAAILFCLSAVLAPFTRSREKAAALTLLLAGIAVNEATAFLMARAYNLHDTDTRYSRVRILDTTKKSNGRMIRAMSIDPFIYQSSMYLDDGSPASEYHHFYHLIRHFKPGFQRVLMIGGAGYSFPKEYLARYPGRKIDVVEIDPGMTRLAREHFRVKDDPDMRIIHEDGRVFLNRATGGSYDAVLMDAFSTLFSVPYQLTTLEAATEIYRVLSDDGLVVFNIGGALSGDAAMFLGAEVETYQQVFPRVEIFRVDPSKRKDSVQNIILVAFKSSGGTFDPESKDREIQALLAKRASQNEIAEMPVITDDLAPVEYYSSFAQSRLAADMR